LNFIDLFKCVVKKCIAFFFSFSKNFRFESFETNRAQEKKERYKDIFDILRKRDFFSFCFVFILNSC